MLFFPVVLKSYRTVTPEPLIYIFFFPFSFSFFHKDYCFFYCHSIKKATYIRFSIFLFFLSHKPLLIILFLFLLFCHSIKKATYIFISIFFFFLSQTLLLFFLPEHQKRNLYFHFHFYFLFFSFFLSQRLYDVLDTWPTSCASTTYTNTYFHLGPNDQPKIYTHFDLSVSKVCRQYSKEIGQRH